MISDEVAHMHNQPEGRPKIAFFDYPDVYEDFYTHYGVSQSNFASWQNTANHTWLEIIQQNIGDVTWYITCIKPELRETVHEKVGCKLKFFKSSLLHRLLWKAFYLPSFSWRWRKFYRSYAAIASYLAPMSFSLLKTLYKDKPDVIFVQDYQIAILNLNTDGGGDAAFTWKMCGSIQENAPDFAAAKSTTNSYEYISTVDYQSAGGILGDTGFVVATADDNRLLEYNVSKLRWAGLVATAGTEGELDSDLMLSNNS